MHLKGCERINELHQRRRRRHHRSYCLTICKDVEWLKWLEEEENEDENAAVSDISPSYKW